MRILVLGGDGMLGHALLEELGPRHQVWATLHRDRPSYAAHAALFRERALYRIDVRQHAALRRALAAARPEAVVNAVGLVKQRAEVKDAVAAVELNALFPHRLARLCGEVGARLVHFSTDCVFSGLRGRYAETDLPDPVDLYGRSKLLGEPSGAACLTLRTSMIGLELSRRSGLVEWFLAQRGPVRGYRRAVFSGLTTRELARAVERLLEKAGGPSGLYHLAAEPISKHELLARLSARLGRKDVELIPDDEVVCDRSLDGRALAALTTYRVPSWDAMLDELAASIRQRSAAP